MKHDSTSVSRPSRPRSTSLNSQPTRSPLFVPATRLVNHARGPHTITPISSSWPTSGAPTTRRLGSVAVVFGTRTVSTPSRCSAVVAHTSASRGSLKVFATRAPVLLVSPRTVSTSRSARMSRSAAATPAATMVILYGLASFSLGSSFAIGLSSRLLVGGDLDARRLRLGLLQHGDGDNAVHALSHRLLRVRVGREGDRVVDKVR